MEKLDNPHFAVAVWAKVEDIIDIQSLLLKQKHPTHTQCMTERSNLHRTKHLRRAGGQYDEYVIWGVARP